MNLEIAWRGVSRRRKTVEKKKTVSAQEEIRLEIRLLPILPEALLGEILREVLQERGWKENKDGLLEKSIGEAKATLSAEGDAVILSQQLQEQVNQSKQQDAQKRLSEELMTQLTSLEPELRAEIQEALNQTYRRALEKRAREMGELESIQESGEVDGTYEVTVTVRA